MNVSKESPPLPISDLGRVGDAGVGRLLAARDLPLADQARAGIYP